MSDDQPELTPPPATPGVPAEPSDLTLTSAQLTARLERHYKSQLRKQFGTDDPSTITAQLEAAKAFEAAESERKRASMSELERVQTELKTERATRAAAEAERDQVRYENHIAGVCAKLGVRNIEYAMHIAGRAAGALPDGEVLDVSEYLTAQIAAPTNRAALGVDTAPTQVAVGVQTTPADPSQPTPQPPPAGPGAPPPVDAMTMTPAMFRAHIAGLGGH